MKETILTLNSPFSGPVEVRKNYWEGDKSEDSLSLVGGIYGNSVNGLYILSRLSRLLDEIQEGRETNYQLTGSVQIFPVVNLHAAQTGNRFGRFDELDMDMAFPGSDKGEMSERLANVILEHTAESTFGLLLETAGPHYESAPHIQCFQPDGTVKKMARHLGLEVARELPESPSLKVRLFYQWVMSGLSSLILSAGKPGVLDKDLCDFLVDGIVNLMIKTGILSGEDVQNAKGRISVYGPRNECRIVSSTGGLFVARTRAGKALKADDPVGEIRDLYSGETLELVTAPEEGYLVTMRDFPLIYENETVAVLLTPKKSWFWPF